MKKIIINCGIAITMLFLCVQVQAVEYTRIVFDVILERPMDADTIARLKVIQTEVDALKSKFKDINEQEKTTTKMNICRHGATAAENQPCDPYVEFKEIDMDKANDAELTTKPKPSPTLDPKIKAEATPKPK